MTRVAIAPNIPKSIITHLGSNNMISLGLVVYCGEWHAYVELPWVWQEQEKELAVRRLAVQLEEEGRQVRGEFQHMVLE